MQENDPIYSDSLITITKGGILFKRYGMLRGDRFVPLSEIEKILVKKPTIWNGKWRIHGTGNFRTWFPEDNNRPKCDAIFVAYIRKKWWRIGFTVEDSPLVVDILQDKGLVDKTADMVLAETVELRGQSMIKPDPGYLRGARLLIFIIGITLLFSVITTLIVAFLT